jgi:MSHA biogenesis protein MshL
MELQNKHLGVYCLVAGLLLLAGCQTMPENTGSARVQDSMADALDEAAASKSRRPPIDIPPDVSRALLPPMALPGQVGKSLPLERRFDVSANKAPAREVFMSLAQGTAYSMVVHPELDGEISVDLKGVTLIEAMEVLRAVHGYEYRRDGHRIMVLGQGLRTRIFPVNYLTMNRRGHSETTVSTSQLSNISGGGGDSADSSGGGSSSSGGAGGIRVETTSQADFWNELRSTLETIIGDEDGRRVVTNPQSSLVIVRAMPHELDMVEDFLGITHTNINRQVVLEAKILEVELSDGFQSGINWGMLGSSGSWEALGSQVGGGTLFQNGVSDIVSNSGNLNPGNFTPVTSTLASAFGGIFTLQLKRGDDFAAFVELLKGQGNVQVLSSPRVSTVNNQKAVIKVGGDEFYITGVTNSTVSEGATTTNSPEVELQAFFSGIALDVTPQIDEHENIILHIHPTISEVTQSTKSFVIGGENFNLPLAASTVQESDNVVRSKSGQIIVIGGLMKEASNEHEASVPLLGDLPLIGNLFKHTQVSHFKKELVILLKPTVMVDGRDWKKAIQASQANLVNVSETVRP